eukprot:SAG25_NODE_852_length_5073_cov_31.793727_3_plen_273_part_00
MKRRRDPWEVVQGGTARAGGDADRERRARVTRAGGRRAYMPWSQPHTTDLTLASSSNLAIPCAHAQTRAPGASGTQGGGDDRHRGRRLPLRWGAARSFTRSAAVGSIHLWRLYTRRAAHTGAHRDVRLPPERALRLVTHVCLARRSVRRWRGGALLVRGKAQQEPDRERPAAGPPLLGCAAAMLLLTAHAQPAAAALERAAQPNLDRLPPLHMADGCSSCLMADACCCAGCMHSIVRQPKCKKNVRPPSRKALQAAVERPPRLRPQKAPAVQ